MEPVWSCNVWSASIEGMNVDEVLRRQAGVISRLQALDTGMQDHDIRRLLRRNEWARVYDGGYVDHTGPLTAFRGSCP